MVNWGFCKFILCCNFMLRAAHEGQAGLHSNRQVMLAGPGWICGGSFGAGDGSVFLWKLFFRYKKGCVSRVDFESG